MYQIIDLDGCIADDRWRRSRILPGDAEGRFREYHSLCGMDDVLNINEIRSERVIVITGRPVRHKAETLRWLYRKASITPHHILMRNPDLDHIPGVALKRIMVSWLFEPNLLYNIPHAEIFDVIDDRADIVEMYKSEFNLPARIVRIGDEEHSNG